MPERRTDGAVFLIVAMLSLLIAFFALFAGLVGFADHVIRPRAEAASPSGDDQAEPDAIRSAAP